MKKISLLTALVAALTAVAGIPTASAQQPAEAAYLVARDSAIRSLDARVKGGAHYPTYIPAHDSALRSLETRLRAIIGPVHAKGFSGPGRINLESLFPEEGFGMLDALVFQGDDHQSELWVTTRPLINAWVPPAVFRVPRVDSAWRTPDFYTGALEADAAVYHYGSITLADAKSLGVVQVMMIRFAQDDSPLPPDQLLLTVARGRMVMIVVAPIAVTIPPPHQCAVMRDSLEKRATAARERYFRSNRSDTAALRRDEDDSALAQTTYRRCYGERAPLNPAFKRIVMQARSIAAALP